MTSLSGVAAPPAAVLQDTGTLSIDTPRGDTTQTWGCEYGSDPFGRMEQRNFYVLDTGREGPDDVRIVIHENGDVTVTVNGEEYRYAAEDPRQDSFLRVRVDDGDRVQVEDRRPVMDQVQNPRPVQVFKYP